MGKITYNLYFKNKTFINIQKPHIRMTLKTKIKDKDELKSVLDVIGSLSEEANFVATEDGITIREMDPSHVAMVNISWPKEAFLEYNLEVEEYGDEEPSAGEDSEGEEVNTNEYKFAVDVKKFLEILKRGDKHAGVELTIDDEFLKIVIDDGAKSYDLRPKLASTSDSPLPKLTHTASFVMSGTELKTKIEDIVPISDYVSMFADEKGGYFSGKGDDGAGKTQVDIEGEGEATYAIEYILSVVKNLGSNEIKCQYGEKAPINMNVKFEGCNLDFYLAPRLED